MKRHNPVKMEKWPTWVAIALLVPACGAGSGGATDPDNTAASALPTTSTADPSPEVIHSGDLRVIVPPDPEGNLAPDLTVGCWSGPSFQVSDLDVIQPLEEADPGGVARAIEPFLSGEEGAFWPQDGWLILRGTDDEVLLVHSGKEGLSFLTTEFIDGRWQWSGASSGGPCPLYYQVPEELNPVDWRLDPEYVPSADTTTIDVLITERSCVDGREIGDRLRGPEVIMTQDELRIAFAAQPPPGDFFTCPGNPETGYRVTLPAPLGDREIVEGLAIGIDLEDYLP